MITGKDLIDDGWDQGKAVGLAIRAANAVEPDQMLLRGDADDETIRQWRIDFVRAIRMNPRDFLEVTTHDEVRDLAWQVIRDREQAERIDGLAEHRIPYNIYGEGLIETGTFDQMDEACRVPSAVGGVLLPDAHQAYGLPVGGVLATKDTVIPYAVGVDIACRMRMSIFDMPAFVLDQRRRDFVDILIRATNFGKGSKYKEGRRVDHKVLYDSAWDATPFLRGLKDKAAEQLGTSGSGNHFVELGEFTPYIGPEPPTSPVATSLLPGLNPGRRYLAVVSHSGSRAPGFKIANRYTKIAKQQRPKAGNLAWLDLGTEEAEEYWLSMQLAGRYAEANHAVIHDKIALALGRTPALVIENHHNFAWQEILGGEDVVVHRKGATPAGNKVRGIVPGSMATPAFVVEGRGNEDSIQSASHGAGRTMSRTQAFKTLDARAEWQKIRDAGVTVIGGALDESPAAYKDIEEVMAMQEDLVRVVGEFQPRIVRMDGEKDQDRRLNPTDQELATA